MQQKKKNLCSVPICSHSQAIKYSSLVSGPNSGGGLQTKSTDAFMVKQSKTIVKIKIVLLLHLYNKNTQGSDNY